MVPTPSSTAIPQVLSLGDQRSYYLGTAKNELGVVYAKHPVSGGIYMSFP